MKILVLNGSPKGGNSNTMKLTNAFLEGMAERTPLVTEILTVSKMNIRPCTGCFKCWSATPGECRIHDDMASVIEKMLAADMILWSFPLYYYGLPSQLKALMDRQLPMNLPFMAKGTGEDFDSGSHPSRYDMSGKRYVLISTCGFYTAKGNYDSVDLQFVHCLGKGNYEAIYCGEGELFSVPELRGRTDEYLETVKSAGREFVSGGITRETKELLEELLFPREVFEEMADNSWGPNAGGENGSGPEHDASLPFTRQMAALYNPAAWDGTDKVLEMCYTDAGSTYQILMGKDGQSVITENFLPFTARIETPLSLWQSIAKGETDGQTAMMEHRYRVEGDFSLLVRWNDFFGSRPGRSTPPEGGKPEKKSNMSLMLFPWISIWFLMAVNPALGGAMGIIAGAVLPFFYFKYKATVFECLSGLMVSCIGLFALTGFPVSILKPVSYLLFGIMWSATVFLKIPLTAYYSMYGHGEEKALKNPLFMRTNRILTACWGGLYLMTFIWSWFIMQSRFPMVLDIVNTIMPALLGAFTKWFQKWYPAYYAGKSRSF
ncbi:flavodoxin family protein [Lachnospiraceae bacterium 54-53]